MATFESTITLTSAEYRPCYVDDKKALFHRWEECSQIVPPSPMVGGHAGGVLKYTLAIIEYDDGKIAEVEPSSIQFADDKMKEYAYKPTSAGTTENELLRVRQDYEALLKRFSHLTKSEVIRQYDVHDIHTHKYKKDILQFDKEFQKYKEAFEILSKCTNCNNCIKQRDCEFIKWGDQVRYNCPHFEEEIK